MGYRSEVAIGLTDDAARLLEAIMLVDDEVADLVRSGNQTMPLASDPTREDRGGKLYWDWIKWYDMFDDVSKMENFLAILPDEDYKFVRLGEESDDVEERGHYYDAEIYVSRSISW